MSRFFSLFSFLCCAIFLLSSEVSLAADGNIYLVDNIPVEVTGKSPSAARQSATATARRDAFLVLLGRLGLNINVADNITNDEISDMVRSEQIDGEKMAGNTYSATFNIMFAKDFVNHILTQKTKKKISDKSFEKDENVAGKKEEKFEEVQLLIPVHMIRSKSVVWEEGNDWRKAIIKNLSKKSQKRFIVPEPDVENISILNQDSVKNIEFAALDPILFKNHAESAYTLFFNYDTIENKVNIDVFYIRRMQKKQIKLSFINVDLLSQEALLDKVADKTIEYLSNVQAPESKALNANLIRIEIPIGRLDDWLAIKSKLENSNLISQLNIEAISRDRVLISVNYLDAVVKIENAFAKIGINLDQKSENFYVLR